MFWRETKLFIQKGDEIRSIDGKYKNTEELGIHVTIRSNALTTSLTHQQQIDTWRSVGK